MIVAPGVTRWATVAVVLAIYIALPDGITPGEWRWARWVLPPTVLLASSALWFAWTPAALLRQPLPSWRLAAVTTAIGLGIACVALSPWCLPLAAERYSLGATLSLLFLVPLAEEAFFRGVVLSFLRRERGLAVGVVGSSLLFALMHLGRSNVLGMFVLGLIASGFVVLGRSVAWGVVFHIMWNGLCVVAQAPLQSRVAYAAATALALILVTMAARRWGSSYAA